MLKELPVPDVEGPPFVDTGKWHLKVGGLVKNPATVSVDEIKRIAPAGQTFPLIRVEGRDTRVRRSGMRLREFIEIVQPLPEAKYLTFRAYSEYFDSLSRDYPAEAGIADEKRMEYGL